MMVPICRYNQIISFTYTFSVTFFVKRFPGTWKFKFPKISFKFAIKNRKIMIANKPTKLKRSKNPRFPGWYTFVFHTTKFYIKFTSSGIKIVKLKGNKVITSRIVKKPKQKTTKKPKNGKKPKTLLRKKLTKAKKVSTGKKPSKGKKPKTGNKPNKNNKPNKTKKPSKSKRPTKNKKPKKGKKSKKPRKGKYSNFISHYV